MDGYELPDGVIELTIAITSLALLALLLLVVTVLQREQRRILRDTRFPSRPRL